MAAHFSKPVPAGFIFITTEDVTFRFAMTEELCSEARSALASMRNMIGREIFPEPTTVRGRFADCEYRNFCADIF